MDATVVWAGAGVALATAAVAVVVRGALIRRAITRAEALETQRAALDERDERLTRREEALDAVLRNVQEREQQAAELHARAEQVLSKQTRELERLSGWSAERARRELVTREEEQLRRSTQKLAADMEAEARETAECRAKDILATAIQRVTLDVVTAATAVVVTLPDGDMKARIIGREGRNIRAFEERTGVNLVVDELPDGVILSSFDPRRREVARVALCELLQDGRIYPSTIEAAYERAVASVAVDAQRAARDAAATARISDLHPELVRLLGELHFRSSYGQNVLQHSLEVAHLAGLMALELDLDADLARRAGLLHDIGKAAGHEDEGSHASLSAEFAARYGESAVVCHAIEAHHRGVDAVTAEAVLVQAADQVSLNRPGGRREHLEQHMSRMRRIEELCLAFDGVVRAHVVQAGREIRVMVGPEQVGDDDTRDLARRIAERVERELNHPGRITVTVVRELRATETVR